MRCGSLFSGIGGFDLGFERAGIETIWQVEKEAFCLKILARHFPKAKRYTEIKNVCGVDCNDPGRWQQGEPPCEKRDHLAPVDIITAGVPCQDVSVAGNRAGLSGRRTGLFFEFARLLRELRPRWFVFENVPGLFSTNGGRDFAEVLRVLMVECGYGISWRVLDSRYFGVAQRRRRVFIVGRLGEPCPAEILFERPGSGGNFAPGEEAGTDIAVPLTSGSGSVGHQPGRRQEDDFNIVKQAISSKWSKGSSGPSGDEHHNLTVIQDVRGGTRDKTDAGQGIGIRDSEECYTLSATEQHGVAYTIRSEYGEKAYRGDGADNFVCFDTTQITNRDNRSNPQPGDPCHSLAAGAHAPAIAGTLGSSDGGFKTTDLDGNGAYISAPVDADRMRNFAGLPEGLDSARYRALGNAVTVSVARWIAERIVAYDSGSLASL